MALLVGAKISLRVIVIYSFVEFKIIDRYISGFVVD
jgi:hypothetical protein